MGNALDKGFQGQGQHTRHADAFDLCGCEFVHDSESALRWRFASALPCACQPVVMLLNYWLTSGAHKEKYSNHHGQAKNVSDARLLQGCGPATLIGCLTKETSCLPYDAKERFTKVRPHESLLRQGNSGNTPLHYAAGMGEYIECRKLIDSRKWDVNARKFRANPPFRLIRLKA